LDRSGEGVLVASKTKEGADLNDDRRLRELTSDPSDMNLFITDGG